MITLKQYKIVTGNPGAYYLTIPPEYIRTFSLSKSQRLYAYMGERELRFKRNSVVTSTQDNSLVPLGMYHISSNGLRGHKVTVPKIFMNAKNLDLGSQLTASMTKEGDLVYRKEYNVDTVKEYTNTTK